MYNQLPEYNGWTNKPTWAANLWINNIQADQEYWDKQAEEIVEEIQEDLGAEDHGSAHVWELAKRMESYYQDRMYEEYDAATMFGDLMQFAFAYVNWHEIAEHFISTYKERK